MNMSDNEEPLYDTKGSLYFFLKSYSCSLSSPPRIRVPPVLERVSDLQFSVSSHLLRQLQLRPVIEAIGMQAHQVWNRSI